MITRLARGFRSRRFRTSVLLPVIFLAFLIVAFDTARACWTTILTECFERPGPQWPWDPPGPGQWRVFPTSPRWGVHVGNFYDPLFCPDDNQSLWCYGYPSANDPEFNFYPSNYNTYVTFGPISLSDAHAAHVLWSMWSRTEVVHDSVFWGAATTFTLSDPVMKIGGSTWSETNDWQRYDMDLSNLHDFLTGDSVSMLGLGAVYVFWRFRSDPNQIRDIGTFIDDITIATDDSLPDLRVYDLDIVQPDSDSVEGDPEVGQTIMAHFKWNACSGVIQNYDPFRLIAALGTTVLVDTVLSGVVAMDQGEFYSAPWLLTAEGDFSVRVKIDTLDQIIEADEVNNIANRPFQAVPHNFPPEFNWITPGTDTLWADTSVVLRWFANDPFEQGTISLYYDNEPQGCIALAIPGGTNRPELGAEDSLFWDIHVLPNARTYYLFARVIDSANDTCIYAPWPMLVCHGCTPARERPLSVIPEKYFVEQNYPNPFNPVTDIRYGIAVPGRVSLKVFDVLGREVETLVNDHRDPGSYVVSFDGASLPSGVYLYVLTTPEGRLGRKMMLLK